MYSSWASAFHGFEATPADAAYFYDRTLPGFQDRITMWPGRDPDACRAGQHSSGWNDLTGKIESHGGRTAATLRSLREDYASHLSTLYSTPVAGKERR
ncbi:hypothetical protein CLV47_10180 [Antricoccus suffuscus]|uniref:Uncharacterized protein n=1 Tax=Antricoccus suffuscus TaxID=1629062 RepID=A0A2T1A5U0_9ACTN|nr:hypothetical protein CLV47_10180 [Antricoccus suffuscus]